MDKKADIMADTEYGRLLQDTLDTREKISDDIDRLVDITWNRGYGEGYLSALTKMNIMVEFLKEIINEERHYHYIKKSGERPQCVYCYGHLDDHFPDCVISKITRYLGGGGANDSSATQALGNVTNQQ